MKNLHLFPNVKFTEPYIDFINTNFDSKYHLFLIIGNGVGDKIKQRDNVKKISMDFQSILLLIREMYSCEKIILHGLFSPPIVIMLFFQPWLLEKSNWCVWGSDLYWYKYRNQSFKANIYERLRGFVIRNMGGLITHIKGDYELAQKWYGAKGKYIYSFLYPSNLFKEYDLSKENKEDIRTYIQVGNSANPTNNHIEIFNKLENFKDEPIEVICPLSYGNPEYRERVIEEGSKIFGDKFKPLEDFIPFEEYLELLAKIDIAIFNHERQQAMGNIITLLGLGKKVYIRDDITTWEFCIDHGLKVNSSNEDFNELFKEISNSERFNNISNIKKYFSKEKLISDWNDIFK